MSERAKIVNHKIGVSLCSAKSFQGCQKCF